MLINRVKQLLSFVLIALALVGLIRPQTSISAQSNLDNDAQKTLFQVSTYDYFAAGNMDGIMSLSDLQHYGDYGLGTVDKIDGEMIEVDGKIYQVTSDGQAHTPDGTLTTPFAVVSFWQPSASVPVKAGMSMDDLKKQIDSVAPNQNVFVVIRIEGAFTTLKLRSVPVQAKPYPTLTDVVKNQVVFDHTNISGVLVGVRSPAFSKGLNAVGYHFHFISADRKTGGHVLDLTTGEATLKINEKPLWKLYLATN